jgi:hypothetical protein
VLLALKPLIDKRQLETAHRLHSEISAIFAYAIVHNFTDYDPAQPVGKQIPAQKVKHRAAIIDPKQVGQLLRDIYAYQGTYVVQMALRLRHYCFNDQVKSVKCFGLMWIWTQRNGGLMFQKPIFGVQDAAKIRRSETIGGRCDIFSPCNNGLCIVHATISSTR